MSYYVEPDYWVSGYAEGDSSGSALVYGAGAVAGTGTTKIAGNLIIESFVVLPTATSTIKVGGALLQFYPGINLNAKSETIAAGVYRTKGGGLMTAQSATKASGRNFWETTTPATGTWIEIVPQAEGSGQ